MINILRVGTPQPFLFKKITQWCMTGLNLTPHSKCSTILCCQNSYIIILYRPTRNRSVQKNDQHVQGWNPTRIPFLTFFNAHGVFPYLVALRLDLAARTKGVAVFFFKSKVLGKRHSDFQARGFLTGVDVMVDIGL